MRTRKIYTLRYVINGATFNRKYLNRTARDAYADLLATNGVRVTCKTRLSKPNEVVRDTHVRFVV